MGLQSGGLAKQDDTGSKVYTGSFLVSATGPIAISGIGFEPDLVKFRASPSVDSKTVDTHTNSGDGADNYSGNTIGFARKESDGTITQETTHGGLSGNSVNASSLYASTSQCLTVRYADADGFLLGKTTLSFSSTNSDGFEVSVDALQRNQVVHYTAYK